MKTKNHKHDFWYKMRFLGRISYITSEIFRRDNQPHELNSKSVK